MAFLQLEDMSGSCEVVVFARTFEECAALLRPDAVIVVRGKVESQRSGGDAALIAGADEDLGEPAPAKLVAESVMALEDPRLLTWRADQTVHITVGHANARFAAALKRCVDEHAGDIPVVVHVEHAGKIDEISLGPENGVSPSPGLERSVIALLGEGAYRVDVRRGRAQVPQWKRNGNGASVTAARRE
jgi:DNA polymerase-3 subunit alpha